MARLAVGDTFYWLRYCTKTKDEQDQRDPYKPFPDWPMFPHLFQMATHEPVWMIEKTRTVMLSWTVAAWSAHMAFNRPAVGVVFQSTDLARAVKVIKYVKELWRNSIDPLRDRWRLAKRLEDQPQDFLELAHGSWLKAIPGDPDNIRSEHPTIVILDEAAHMEQGDASYDIALATRCPHIGCLTSAAPGWFRDFTEFARPVDWPDYEAGDGAVTFGVTPPDPGRDAMATVRIPCPGLSMRRTKVGIPVVRVDIQVRGDLTPEWEETVKSRFKSEARFRREIKVEYDAEQGQRVYPEFDQAVHVLADAAVPVRGCRYMSIDPHPRTPHAFLWVLLDPWGDWYVYRELWPSAVEGDPRQGSEDDQDPLFTIKDYAETLAALEGNRLDWRRGGDREEYALYSIQGGGERIVQRFMDQAAKGFIATGEGEDEETYADRYQRYGIICVDPLKSRGAGEDAIHDLLRLRRHERFGLWPRLHVAASCKELIVEFFKHRYPRSSDRWLKERDPKQQGVQARRHQIDNLRYLATSSISYLPQLAS